MYLTRALGPREGFLQNPAHFCADRGRRLVTLLPLIDQRVRLLGRRVLVNLVLVVLQPPRELGKVDAGAEHTHGPRRGFGVAAARQRHVVVERAGTAGRVVVVEVAG